MCFGSDPYALEFGYFFASIKPAVTKLFAWGSMLKEWWVLFFVISGDSSLIYITSHCDYVVFLFRASHTLLNRWIAVQISRVCCSLFGRKCHRPGCWYLTFSLSSFVIIDCCLAHGFVYLRCYTNIPLLFVDRLITVVFVACHFGTSSSCFSHTVNLSWVRI